MGTTEVIKREKDLPPLIVHYFVESGKTEGEFELNDGNHRWEAYSRLDIKEVYVIIWITENEELDLFLSKFASDYNLSNPRNLVP